MVTSRVDILVGTMMEALNILDPADKLQDHSYTQCQTQV